MKLKTLYKNYISKHDFTEDVIQLKCISELQTIYDALTIKKKCFFFKKHNKDIKGIYMWGDVGRGKTFIMDMFYNSLPKKIKMRRHFNHFMSLIHKLLKRYNGQNRPLEKIATLISKNRKIICFDEFFVEDIADAMILGNLFKHLFEKGIVLVATSNIDAKNLYLGGLQRELFLPAIKTIIENTQIYNMNGEIDYRSQENESSLDFYYYGKNANEKCLDKFNQLSTDKSITKNSFIDVEKRKINFLAMTDEIIWFDFAMICGNGRGVQDYIYLCRKYSHIVITNMPQFCDTNNDLARRYIALVDEAYEKRTILVMGANSDINSIYSGNKLKFIFKRAISRIKEMQLESYIKK